MDADYIAARARLLHGLVFLLVGMVPGLKMSMRRDFTLHGLHAQLNLMGFLVMTLFGLCYRHWPKMHEGMLAAAHYFLHTVTVAVPVGACNTPASDYKYRVASGL